MGEFINWKTILIFIAAFIVGMILRYFLTRNSNSMDRVKKKKKQKQREKSNKPNLGAVKGTAPQKKNKKKRK